MARSDDLGFEVQSWMLDQENLDPLACSVMDIDVAVAYKIKPTKLVFKEANSFFSDPWADERPLTPLDQNVPGWFQRRKLALVPEELLSCSVEIPTLALDPEMELDNQQDMTCDTSISKSVRRTRSSIDMTNRIARDSVFFDQYSPCGQVMNELMKTPAIQSMFSRKRKADNANLAIDDGSAMRKRRTSIPHTCNYEGALGREMGMTLLDFRAWNFGFDVNIATVSMC